jgi:hypothetical protein
MKVEDIAAICHDANRTLCLLQGDFSQVAWPSAPDWQKKSAIAGVEFHLRQHVRPVPPSASHESWLREKEADGWKYGPVKDADKKEHPCFVPYDELPPEQKAKDYLFGAIVSALEPFLDALEPFLDDLVVRE